MPGFNTYLRVMIALLSALLQCGCLMTKGVIDRAYDRYPPYVDITQVKTAAALNDILYLTLEVQSREQPSSRTILFKIPFEDIGTYRHGAPATPLYQDGLNLQTPSLGYIEPITSLPEGVISLELEYVDIGASQALADHIYNLPLGIHVLIVYNSFGKYGRVVPFAPTDGTIPDRGRLLLIQRISDGAPRELTLRVFQEVPEQRRAWLFMMPLAIAGDIVTFPVQIMIVFGD